MCSAPFGRFILIILLFVFAGVSNIYTQSITPYTLNNGGGLATNMDWSMGETVSIAHFTTANYILNTGVLQPNTTIVTAINEYGPAVFGNQITIGPNPTRNVLHIHAKFNELGSLSFQLLDAKSATVLTNEVGTISNIYQKDIVMQNYPSGVFYMKVYFKPNNGSAKTGIYKIIKL